MEDEVRKVISPAMVAYRKWHYDMAENFKRLANGSVARGFPDSVQYFEQKSYDHINAASKIRGS